MFLFPRRTSFEECCRQMIRKRLVLIIARASNADRDLAVMTIGWLAKDAGALCDTYYAVDHGDGGLFAPYGSTVIGGDHSARLARALASFDTLVVRLDGVSIFASLIARGAKHVIDTPTVSPGFYAQIAEAMNQPAPESAVIIDPAAGISPSVFYAEVAARRAMALPSGGGETIDLFNDADPALACVRRHLAGASGIDLYEPTVASAQLAFNQRHGRLILPYRTREEAVVRRDQMLELLKDRPQAVSYGRWFGDPQLLPLADVPTAYNVVEPHRQVLSVFDDQPTTLPQPKASFTDLEPADAQILQWMNEGKVLASWLLHSGEQSHNDSVLTFMDWASMTKVKLGAGVHWQRYYGDPDVVEPMQVPTDEGGVLGLVEPVLHSAGAGIMWETAGDPVRIAAIMRASRDRIAQVSGARFAPRGVYCFGDQHEQPAGAMQPGTRQLALWKAVADAGFEYLITSVLPGAGPVLFRRDNFVVLNQTAAVYTSSPFVRGTVETFTAEEKRLASANRPGWLIGAIDTPIHGCPIYIGRPYGKKQKDVPINAFFDYCQNGGATGRLVSVTPRTVARYARMISMETSP